MNRGENFDIVIFAKKKLFSMHDLVRSSMVSYLSVLHTFIKKKMKVKTLPMDIFDSFGRYQSCIRYQSIFEWTDLKSMPLFFFI